MRDVVLISALIVFGVAAMAADLTDYEHVAVSAPLITQIYTNPELTRLEDVELSPETQIRLYEEFGEQICGALRKRFDKVIEFSCLNDIQQSLATDDWSDFNRLFTGQNSLDTSASHDLGEKLNADGVLNTYLMFSYYKDNGDKRFLEVHFEWYLVDLVSGVTTVEDKYDCREEFEDEEEALARELKCFDNIIGIFKDLGR